MQNAFTECFSDISTKSHFQYIFYCDICHCGYKTERIKTSHEQQDTAFNQLQKEARQQFNRCHLCQRWVCDLDFNEDMSLCRECTSKES